MKNTIKIFTVLFTAFVTMPCFADEIDCNTLATNVFDKCSDIAVNSLETAKKSACMRKVQNNAEIVGPMFDAILDFLNNNLSADMKAAPWIRVESYLDEKKDVVLPTLRQKCQEAVQSISTTPSVAAAPANSTVAATGSAEGGAQSAETKSKRGKTNQDKATCESKATSGAKWSVNKCICTDKNKKWDGSDCIAKTADELKAEKKATQRKGMVCTDAKKHHLMARYNDNQECIVESCVTGYNLNKDTNECVLSDKSKATPDKATCESKATSGAKWSVNKCICTDKNKKWDGSDCVDKTQEELKAEKKATQRKGMACTDAKKHHLLAKYNDNQECIVESCVTGYKLDKDNNQCVLSDKAQAKQDTKEADDAYSQAVDEIVAAYKQVVEKLKADCKRQGGTLTDTECKPKQG